MDCASQDEARIDVINGQNGNTGDHYNRISRAPVMMRLDYCARLHGSRWSVPGSTTSLPASAAWKTVAAFNAITGRI